MKRKRSSETQELQTGCGQLFVTTIFNDKMEIKDLLIHFGKAGGCASAATAAVRDLTAVALDNNLPIEMVIKALKGHSCHQSNKKSTPPIPSCIEAISDVLDVIANRGTEKAAVHA